jgi:flavin reductase (DIM6/NTAB) family NADH-FMN oxidoreductase RutF
MVKSLRSLRLCGELLQELLGEKMEPKTFHKLGYGMYVVSSKKGKRFNGQIANTVFQITSKPPTIAVSINKKNLTHNFILESKLFTVSILSTETPMKFIGRFGFKSGREIDKFEGVDYQVGVTGTPIVLENSIGYLEAAVINTLDVGTHVVFVGKVVDAQILKDGEPMTYAYYHKVKGGKVPKAAPTYIDQKGTE